MDLNEFKEKVKSYGELELYLTIDGLGAVMWQMSHELKRGHIEYDDRESVEESVMDMSKRQLLAAEELNRFGVDFKVIEKDGLLGKYNAACDDYKKWLQHWNNWKFSLSDSQWHVSRK